MLAALSISACVAFIPLAIKYAKTDKGYVSTVEIPAPADKVYQTAIREA